MAGWASSAVGSVTALTKKNKEKEKFSALQDSDGHPEAVGGDTYDLGLKKSASSQSIGKKAHLRSKSKESLPTRSPKLPPRILKPQSLQEKKIVRALYDFTGSSDELSFKVGDDIVVLNEVLDDWWMGELDGRKGLFPTSYTEITTSKPPLPQRLGRSNSSEGGGSSSLSSQDDLSQHVDAGYGTSDLEDHEFGAPPLTPHHSPFYGVPTDAMSIASSNADDEQSLVRKAPEDRPAHTRKVLQALNPMQQPPVVRRSTTSDLSSSASGKKAPPPPPPRRTTNTGIAASPPIPERRPTISRTHSMSSGSLHPTPTSSVSSHGYDVSPFDSGTEGLTSSSVSTGCGDFKQNPFKPQGMCNNCFQYHA